MKQTPKTTKTGEKPIAQELNQDNLDNILAKQIQKSVIEPLKIYDEENTDRAIELETSFSIEEFKSGLRNEKFLDEIIEFTNEYLRQREIGWIKKDFRGPMFKLAEPESIAALTDGLISYYSKLREKGAGHLDLSILHNAKVLGFALKNELDNKKAIILMEKAGLDQDKELKYVSESINLFTYDLLSFVFEKGKPEAREFISNQFDLLMTKGTIRNLDSLVEKIISSPSVYFKDELARLILNSLSEKLYEARQELQKFGFKPEEVDNVIEYLFSLFSIPLLTILFVSALYFFGEVSDTLTYLLIGMAVIFTSVILISGISGKFIFSKVGMILLVMITQLTVSVRFQPFLDRYKPAKPISEAIKKVSGKEFEIALYNTRFFQALVFYTNKELKWIGSEGSMLQFINSHGEVFVITGEKEYKHLPGDYKKRAEIIGRYPYFPVARINYNFLNPRTRAGVIDYILLTKTR